MAPHAAFLLGLSVGVLIYGIVTVIVARYSRPSAPSTPCPHGFDDWDACPVCCH